MRGPTTHAQSSMRARGGAMELSDSEEEDEILQNDADQEELGDDDLADWTVETFKPRPLRGDNAANLLRELKTKLKDPLDIIEDTLVKFGEVAAAIADCDEKHPTIKQIQRQFLAVLDTRYLLQIKISVLEELERRLRDREDIEDAEKEYQNEVTRRSEEWASKSERTKFKDDEAFATFRQTIWEKNHPDQPDGPASRHLERDDDDEEDSDDEIETGSTIKNYQCPLSRTTLVDAHTSSKCLHSFSGTYIIPMLKQHKRKPIKCPVSGCPAKLSLADVHPDPATQKKADEYIKKKKQRERETARQHEDDDVVEDDD